MLCHSFLACRVSVEKSADSLMKVTLYVVIFPLLLLTFYLSLIFVILITVCLIVFLLGFILLGTLCASWTWLTISFPMSGKFSAIISSNIFLGPFSFSSSSGTPIMWMFVNLMLSQRSFRMFSFVFNLFSISYSTAVISTVLFYISHIHSSASIILLSTPSSVLFISVL